MSILVTYKDSGARYQVSEILDWLEPLPEPSSNGNGKRSRTATAHLAGSEFAKQADLGMMLVNLAFCSMIGEDVISESYHYARAENDVSATRYKEDDHVTIWSETMARELGLELRRPYDAFGLWTMLKHKGDFAAARQDLIANGITDKTYRTSGNGLIDVIPAGAVEVKPERLQVVRASDVTPVAVDWLWPGWAPMGKLITLDGDPGTGKSTMMLDLAARVTTGEPMPDQSMAAIRGSGVVLLSGEDDLEDTIVWRLMAANADLRRVHHVQATVVEDGTLPVSIPRDLDLLVEVIERTGSRMVIVDVLEEYLDEKVDNYRNTQVRKVLHRMAEIAQRTGTVFIMLRHLRKEAGKAIYRGGGSIGIVGAARAGWTVAFHPEDESMRVLAPVKMNLAIRPSAMAFKLMPVEGMGVARVDWRGSIDMGTDELLADRAPADPEEKRDKQSKLDLARTAIVQVAAEWVWSNELLDAVVNKGKLVSLSTFDRARAALDLETQRARMPDGSMGWRVRLRSQDPQDPQDPQG